MCDIFHTCSDTFDGGRWDLSPGLQRSLVQLLSDAVGAIGERAVVDVEGHHGAGVTGLPLDGLDVRPALTARLAGGVADVVGRELGQPDGAHAVRSSSSARGAFRPAPARAPPAWRGRAVC